MEDTFQYLNSYSLLQQVSDQDQSQHNFQDLYIVGVFFIALKYLTHPLTVCNLIIVGSFIMIESLHINFHKGLTTCDAVEKIGNQAFLFITRDLKGSLFLSKQCQDLETIRCNENLILLCAPQWRVKPMKNLLPYNQLNSWHPYDATTMEDEYYECLIECNDSASTCKKICKEVLEQFPSILINIREGNLPFFVV